MSSDPPIPTDPPLPDPHTPTPGPLTASKLRADIYRILDRVLETGVPVDLERKGRMLRIIAVNAPSKLANLKPRAYLATDPEELVVGSWEDMWDAEQALDPSPARRSADDADPEQGDASP